MRILCFGCMNYVLYMCVVFRVVYVLRKCVLCFPNCIVLNSVVFQTSALCFRYKYCVLDKCVVFGQVYCVLHKCIVFYIYVLCFKYMYNVLDTCIMLWTNVLCFGLMGHRTYQM